MAWPHGGDPQLEKAWRWRVLRELGAHLGFERLRQLCAVPTASDGENLRCAAKENGGWRSWREWRAGKGVSMLYPDEYFPVSVSHRRHGGARLPSTIDFFTSTIALSRGDARCGSALGPKGQVHIWTYFFTVRPITLLITKSRFGPVVHRIEPPPCIFTRGHPQALTLVPLGYFLGCVGIPNLEL
jgi:hypothetical protein